MYDYTLHLERKNFYFIVYGAFRTVEKLKCQIKDCFKVNCKQRIKMPKKRWVRYIQKLWKKKKLPFMIYADFESILVPEDNEEQNPNVSYTNKYQKHIA